MMDERLVTVHAVNFRPEAIEIVYSEERENSSDFSSMIRSLTFDPSGFGREVGEMVDVITEVLDRVLVAVRNPPQKFTRARRLVESDMEDADGND